MTAVLHESDRDSKSLASPPPRRPDRGRAAVLHAPHDIFPFRLSIAAAPRGCRVRVPRFAIFSAITDHTAHHRGALTVYARLKGIVPPMPYMDM